MASAGSVLLNPPGAILNQLQIAMHSVLSFAIRVKRYRLVFMYYKDGLIHGITGRRRTAGESKGYCLAVLPKPGVSP